MTYVKCTISNNIINAIIILSRSTKSKPMILVPMARKLINKTALPQQALHPICTFTYHMPMLTNDLPKLI